MKIAFVCVGLCALGLSTGVARAADETRELAAESRFVEGLRLMKEGNCADALVHFRESQDLSPASGTLLDIGYCEANLGHLSRAWLAYRRALSLAESKGKAVHAEMAKREAGQLEPRLGWLSIHLADHLRWSVLLDAEPLSTDFPINDFPVDPGKHTLSASASGQAVLRRPIDIRPGQHTVVEIEAPVLQPKTEAAPPRTESRIEVKPSYPSDVDKSPSRLPLYSLIAGGTFFTSGVVVFAHARYRYDAANCPGNVCVGDDRSQRISARNEAIVSYVLAGTGAALSAAGVVLYLSNSRDKDNAPKLSLDTSGAGCAVRLTGAF